MNGKHTFYGTLNMTPEAAVSLLGLLSIPTTDCFVKKLSDNSIEFCIETQEAKKFNALQNALMYYKDETFLLKRATAA